MKEALFYKKLDQKKVQCFLCPHSCIITEGNKGLCGVRENKNGKFFTLVYGKIIASHLDPIEKKPLFHFYPGTIAYSIATAGCNFKCKHCQNADISQMPHNHKQILGQNLKPENIVKDALGHGAKSISYTYTEPTIFYELAYDSAKLAHEKGLKNNFVTNGYITPEPLKAISPYLDAANVDLKFFDDDLYKRVCGAHLEPVLKTIKLMKKLGIWVEVTTLVIPGLNDSQEHLEKIAEFLVSLDKGIPWHISAFFPTYKMTDKNPTSIDTLHKAREIGLKKGLRYVYCGNIPHNEGENTYCYNCHKLIIGRLGYKIEEYHIKDSKCIFCQAEIDGIGL